MVFSSIPFLFFFFPFCLICYYLTPNRFKNYTLLVFSLFFYAWGEPIYILLMIFSTLVDFLNGRLLSKNNNKKTRRRFLFIAILINLSLLGFFKYTDLLIETINFIFNTNISPLNITLPIGISFYTFQTMSYSIDVYRKDVEPETNYFRYLTYISMFPQLIAGPIVRYETINRELHKRTIVFDNVCKGFLRFLNGLFKKVLIGNNIGYLNSLIMNSDLYSQSILTLWLGIIAFALQIYFDFSGYSDMAIGMGKMLGFSFDENFDYPYASRSITEFWRRWHISLSTWFRDYVYIPLGGNRKGLRKQIRNILFVWALTGIWHGASWNYLLWGIYYGVILVIEKVFLTRYIEKWPNILKHLYTIILLIIGWAIFSIEDVSVLQNYLKLMLTPTLPLIDSNFIFYISNYALTLILGTVFSFPIVKKIPKLAERNILTKILFAIIYIVLFIASVAYLVSDTYNPFMYFRF